MFGLKADFKQNGGTIMVMDRPDGIQSTELNHVQLGMIRSSKIPHLLKLHIKEVDFRVTLEYDITGKKMLSQALKSERMTLTEYYGLLLQIATALDDSKLYMLQPENYILHEDYLYIEGSLNLGTLHLTYVPVAAIDDGSNNLPVLLKELMTRLLASVSELRGGGVQALMSFCSDTSFNLKGFKSLVVELLAREDGDEHRAVNQANSGVPARMNESLPSNAISSRNIAFSKPASAVTEPDNTRTAVQQAEKDANTDKQSLIRSLTERTNEMLGKKGRYEDNASHPDRSNSGSVPAWSFDKDDTIQEATDDDKASPVRTYILLGCLLGMAMAWRLLYMNQPNTLMLGLSVVITIILAAAAWLGWTGKIRLLSRRNDEWSDSLPMFESTELGSQEQSKWRSIPRFQADPLSGLLTGNPGTAKNKSESDPEEGRESWRWKVPEPPSHPERQERFTPSQSYDYSHGHKAEAAASFEEEQGDYYAQLSQRTEMLSSSGASGATVLLSGETAARPAGQRPPSAYLELNEPNVLAPQRIELHQPHFIIGRSPDVAQFVAQGVGTSRAHVELSREGGEYVLKDLGSKNGTVLKGEAMVPYKEYPLMEGDAFIIAGWSFTLRRSLN